jgi:hypothetical protein
LLHVLQKQQGAGEAPRDHCVNHGDSLPAALDQAHKASETRVEVVSEISHENVNAIKARGGDTALAKAAKKKLGKMEAGTWPLVPPQVDSPVMSETLLAPAHTDPAMVDKEDRTKYQPRGWRAKLGLKKGSKKKVDKALVERAGQVELEKGSRTAVNIWKKIVGSF